MNSWKTGLLLLLGIAAIGIMISSVGFAQRQMAVFAFLKPAPVVVVTGKPTSFGQLLATKKPSLTPTPVKK